MISIGGNSSSGISSSVERSAMVAGAVEVEAVGVVVTTIQGEDVDVEIRVHVIVFIVVVTICARTSSINLSWL